MPNDAKLGLIVGVAIVVLVAVVFFRKDSEAIGALGDAVPAAVKAPVPATPGPAHKAARPVSAEHAGPREQVTGQTAERRHVVKEGESLFSLAQQYLGDKGKFTEIYRVNHEVLKDPDQLKPGTELIIPQPED